jgi:cytochrome P450
MELPPGPRAPAAWQTVGWTVRPAAFLRRVHTRFGDPVTIRTFWTDEPMVLFSSPDAVREVFRLDPAVAPAGQSWEFLRPFAGPHSILVLDGDEHLRERRLIQTPFHGERMRAFQPLVAELAREELSSWSGRVVTLERMKRLTLETILRVVFGVRGEREAAELRGAVHGTLDTVRSMPRMLAMSLVQRDLGPHSPWGAFIRRMAVVDEQLMALIARRRREGADGGDVLGQLMAAGLDDAELRDHLVTLLAAGHETTAGSLAWAIERLARAPDVLARLRDGDEAWTDAVIKETLRIRPVLTVAPRKLAAPLRVNGRELPAGVHVAPCIYLVHRREDLYPDAAAWRPERWLGAGAPESFAWIPFGGGVRRCVGAAFATMEMAEVLRVVAAELDLAPATPRPERMRRRGLTLQPGAGARVVLSDASS